MKRAKETEKLRRSANWEIGDAMVKCDMPCFWAAVTSSKLDISKDWADAKDLMIELKST